MAENDPIFVNPFTATDAYHGWRGLGLEGNHKRKWYTVLHNEFVLVTALVLLPGERSIRHTHETGELSVSYLGENQPVVHWNPPGAFHGGVGTPPAAVQIETRAAEALQRVRLNSPDLGEVLSSILQRQVQMEDQIAALTRPRAGLHVLIDILFPPFRTTIDDPAYPEKRTIVGQWYD